jgi:hypothetical protein
MRDKIGKILSLQGCEGYDAIGEILALLAPELEKARFWDEHVKSLPEIANNIKQLRADAEKWRRIERAYNSSPPCDCPEWDSDKAECMIEAAHCTFNDVVNALEGEGGKG